MFLQQAEQIGRILVDNDIFARDMDAKPVRGKVFAVLCIVELVM